MGLVTVRSPGSDGAGADGAGAGACGPVPLSGAVHIQAWCTGRYGRKVYMAAEARLGDAAGPVVVRAAALFVEASVKSRS